MNKLEMTQKIMVAKDAAKLGWEDLAGRVGLNEVFLASACLGQNSMPEQYGRKLAEALGLKEDVVNALAAYPTKGGEQTVPTDPLVYRFYEIMQVYGGSLKQVIQEKCGDGIMSAIDFTMDVERVEDPKGDRIVVTMNGKFLPYRIW